MGGSSRVSSDCYLRLVRILDSAVQADIVPGGVILGAHEGTVQFAQGFGQGQVVPQRWPASTATVYDLASLTKAIITSVLVMRAVADGVLALDAPVGRHLSEFRGAGKDAITVRHLLCHASGLPAHRPFYEASDNSSGSPRWQTRDAHSAIVVAAATEPLVDAPGTVARYSDLGFILLGALLEKIRGQSLDVLFSGTIAEPLGLTCARFVKVRDGEERASLLRARPVAPTEICPTRGGLVQAEVHDLNALAMGGVAGHAGLFSDAADLSAMAAALVGAWHGRDDRLALPAEMMRIFWTPSQIVAGSTWRLGWDGPAATGSQAGARISRRSVGHLGFTGCSLWIDPEIGLWIALLTNRVHPHARHDPRFAAFRAAVQDAAIDALGA